MRILHVLAQKPHSTGSGVYLSGMIAGFKEMGYQQGIIAGLSAGEELPEDQQKMMEGMAFFPLRYETKELNFKILGMSDVMPYESTRYRDMDQEMQDSFVSAFTQVVEEAVRSFNPDLVISHHLYFSTALLRELLPNHKVAGICHGTCLRQLLSHDLQKDYILEQIGKLDMIMALHKDQKEDIEKLFELEENRVRVVGTGYDSTIFYNQKQKKSQDYTELVFTGKVTRQKGIFSLLRALNLVSKEFPDIRLRIIGGSGDKEEMNAIRNTVSSCNYRVEIMGRLETQEEISEIYNQSHIFILPSFYEGLPLVTIEALACGMEVVASNIKGVEDWIVSSLGENDNICFVDLPSMTGPGEPMEAELMTYEERLAQAIRRKILKVQSMTAFQEVPVKKISWLGLCHRIETILLQESSPLSSQD